MTKRIDQLPAETTPNDNDKLAVVDSITGITKYITRANFFAGLLPSGVIAAYGNTVAPTGWLLCDGSAVARSTYANLFSAIGTAYGAGDGSNTFNLPNFKGRVAVGRDSGQTEFNTLNNTGGEKQHTQTVNEMPSHSHSVNDGGHNHGLNDPGHNHAIGPVGTSGSYGFVDSGHASSSGTGFTSSNGTGIWLNASGANISLNNNGSGQAFNVLQPYLVVNYIIKI